MSLPVPQAFAAPEGPGSASEASRRQISPPIELRPYRVLVSIAFAQDPRLSSEFRRSLIDELAESADRVLGAMWQLDVESNSWFAPATAARLERLLPAELPPSRRAPDRLDKLFIMTVETRGSGYVLSAREWDATIDELSMPQTRIVPLRRDVADGLCALALDVFRPLASIEPLEQGRAPVRVRAAEFPPQDPDQNRLFAGQLWHAYQRHLNQENSVDRVQSIPWTYLVVEELPEGGLRGQARCQLVTGLRSPLLKRRRPRLEQIAVAVRATLPETRLRLVSQEHRGKPLIGFEVDIVHDGKTPLRTLLSDRTGSVTIPADPDRAQIWLRIHNGPDLLGRVPYVPGIARQQSIELAEGTIHLDVEAELAVLQANLMDTVAQRAILMARIRKTGQDGDWTKVEALMQNLKKLPTAGSFVSQVNAIRFPAVKKARERKDPAAEKHVERICKETSHLVQRYLEDEKLIALNDELAELKKDQSLRDEFIKTNVQREPPAILQDETPTTPAESSPNPPASSPSL